MNTEDLHAAMPLCALLGMRVVSAEVDAVALELDWSESLCTTAGLVHGGALMALADSAGAVCAFLNLPDGASTSTVSSTTSLVRGVRSGTAHAVARPAHVGRSFILVAVEVTDDDGRLVAEVSQTQAVLS